eukprot:TRINITY_DN14007_c0_g1_i1.p1 TRINITY_DN14007_c0_g1~~TRINITY_DN14007_c0_g1_i1.p1  ORF type:complete len:343 (-),score=78.43 TRINITY_DN14007_c0_g1_i1:994-2022(-)
MAKFLCCLLVISLTIACVHAGLCKERTFADIKGSATEKIVAFYSSDLPESLIGVEVAENTAKKLGSLAECLKCDCSLASNAKDVQEAQFFEFPQLFISSREGGIQKYSGPIDVDEYFDFANTILAPAPTTDDVIEFTTEDALFDLIDGENGKPVFVKFYEQWCSHCKAMKKVFQIGSTKFKDHVHFVEAECSKDDVSKEFCSRNSVEGYPTVKLFTGEDKILFSETRTLAAMSAFFRQHVPAYAAAVPEKKTASVSASSSTTTKKAPTKAPEKAAEKPAAPAAAAASSTTKTATTDEARAEKAKKRNEAMRELQKKIIELEHRVALLEHAQSGRDANVYDEL